MTARRSKQADIQPLAIAANEDWRASGDWRLDGQVGFVMRQAGQRHLTIFSDHIDDMTPTQFSALVTVAQSGPISQNELGRRTAMDAATIKGVVDRLQTRGLITGSRAATDKRRIYLEATAEGRAAAAQRMSIVDAISRETLAPLTAQEQTLFLKLLRKLT